MIPDHLTTIVTGLTYIAASMSLAVVVRLLGPTYHTKVTAPWPVIGFFFVSSAGMLWRGVTLLFPGRMVDTSGMSLIAPSTALIVLGLSLFILDFIMGDRSPPPLFDRYFSWAVRRKLDEDLIVRAAFDLPPAMHTAAPAGAQINRCGRKQRLFVLTGAALAILLVLGIVAASAG